MVKSVTLAFVVIKSKIKKNGLCPILIRYYDGKKRKFYTTKIDVKSDHWDPVREKVKKQDNFFLQKNSRIRQLQTQNETILSEHPFVSFENYIYLLTNRSDLSLIEMFDSYIKELRANMKHSEGTIKNYIKVRNKLINIWPLSVDVESFGEKQLDYYYAACINRFGNQVNSINRTIKTIKTVLRYAKKEGYKIDVTALDYKLKNTQTNRVYLTIEELKKVHSYYDKCPNTSHKKVLKMFLIGCYTGLRYTDIVQLRPSHIVEEVIVKEVQKSNIKKMTSIPLIKQSKKLLKDYPYIEKISNQKCNIYLKQIASVLEIKKHIVFHTSRHTFATVALNLGIPIEVVSEMMTHSKVATTQIYAKVLMSNTKKHMEKFDI